MRILRGLVVVPCLLVSACTMFPAPTPPAPLTKSEVGAVAKCQKSIKKGQLAFTKSALGAVGGCADGVLAARLSFESGLITQEDLDAALAKMREKCTKGYAKVTAASTKLVDGVIKTCTPVETFVLGPYDGLRFQSLFTELAIMPPAPGTPGLAGAICAFGVQVAFAQLWESTPRLMELLNHLGPEFVSFNDADSGYPNVPLDPRCPPVSPP